MIKLKKKQRLDLMGKLVTVSAILRPHTTYNERTLERLPVNNKAGWVVGFRTLREGKIHYGYDDEPNSFQPAGTIDVVLVAYWPTLKPVFVPLDAFTLGGTPEVPGGWTEKERKRWSTIVKNEFKRDDKGRFTA